VKVPSASQMQIGVGKNITRFEPLKSRTSNPNALQIVARPVVTSYPEQVTVIKMASEAPKEKKQPKSFEALTPALAEWILDYTRTMGFARTTPVQAMAIPLLMGNKDLVVEVCARIQAEPCEKREAGLTSVAGCHGKWQDPQLSHPDSESHSGHGP
jgi:hypothetical protein